MTNEISLQIFEKPSNVKSILLFSSKFFPLVFFGKLFVIFCQFVRVQLTNVMYKLRYLADS